jgi:CheY-like chemotaxis protein
MARNCSITSTGGANTRTARLTRSRKDGREALREIKSDPQLRQIPVVILTTSNAVEDIQRTYDLGASSFMIKPRDYKTLVQALETLVNYWFDTVRVPQPQL